MGTYCRRLRRVVGRSSVPYGYTAVTWTSGGMLIDTHGPPTFAGSLMFLAGAILGFSAVSALGGEDGEGRDGASQRHRRRLALTSGAAAIGGLCLAGLVAHDARWAGRVLPRRAGVHDRLFPDRRPRNGVDRPQS